MPSNKTRKLGRKSKSSTHKLISRKIREATDYPVKPGKIITRDGKQCASKNIDDKEAGNFRGYDVSKEMMRKHKTINKDIVLYDCDTGEIVLAYAPKYFAKDKIKEAVSDLEKAAPLTGFRGEAAGKADMMNIKMNISGKKGANISVSKEASWANIYRPSGSRISLSNFVMSGNIGNYARKRLNTVRDATTPTNGTQGLIDESVRFLKDRVPELYKMMMTSIDGKYRYGGDESPFTTITINKDFKTAMHRDKGNLNGYAVLTASHIGSPFKGGRLHFPQYGICVPLREGDALLANVKLLHGNDEIIYPKEDSSRISFVLYSREDFKA